MAYKMGSSIFSREKMLNITNHQRNANQNYIDSHPTVVGMPFSESTNNKCWREYLKKGIFLHFWQEWKLVQSLWRTVRRLLKKLKYDYHMTLQSHS